MGMDQLLTHLAQVFFVLTGIVTGIDFIRHRDRIRRDLALLSGSIAVPVIAGFFAQWLALPGWLVLAGILPLAAQPYLLIRLVRHLRPVPAVIRWTALGGMAACILLMVSSGPDLPLPAYIFIITYFVIVDGYAVMLLVPGVTTAIEQLHNQPKDSTQPTLSLAESEERFRSIYEQAAVGIAEVSLAGQFRQTNDRFCEIVGYPEAELRTRTYQDITHPDDLGHDLMNVKALLDGENASYTTQKRYYRKDGSLVWVNLTVSLVRESGGAAKHFLKIIEDISDRKQAESARREVETRFTRVLDTTAEAVITIDAAHHIILFNQSAERIFGYAADEVLGQPLDLLLPPDVIEQHRRFIENFAQGQDIARGMGQRQRDLQARHKNGTIFPIEASISKLTEGEQVILTVFIRDVTEQRRMESAQREVEARFARVLETTAEAVISIDSAQRILLFNQSAERIFGYTGAEMLGQSLKRLLPPYIMEAHHQFVHDFAEGYDIARGMGQRQRELFAQRKDGTIFPIEASISKLTEDSQIILTVFIQDITERKQAEAALQQLNEELEQRVAERTTQLEVINKELMAFSYSVSHDLRAPLRALDGFSQALLEDYEAHLDEEGKDYLNLIRSESQRMGQLIDGLLELSRLTRTDPYRETVNLSEIAHETAGELRRQDTNRRVEFAIEEELWACADPRLIRVVMQNLLGNAWKYTGKEPSARIEFGSTTDDEEVVYFVRDNGVGFDMNYAHKLFGAFQRLHSVAEFEGTGIGLATVQRIIHQHGGDIQAQGIVGEGATFLFTLGRENCD